MMVARQFIAWDISTAIRPVGYGMTPTRRVCCYIDFTLVVQIIQNAEPQSGQCARPGWQATDKR
jgi:hypothetical protein